MAFYTYVTNLILKRSEVTLPATISLGYFPETYQEIIKFLHHQEKEYLASLRFEKRRKSYLIGRYIAKMAISKLVKEECLQKISISSGVFNQPIVNYAMPNIQVSLTHSDNFSGAIAFLEGHPMGIDLELINNDGHNIDALETYTTSKEKDLVDKLPYNYETKLTFLWTIKEALSKVLKTGLMTPFNLFQVNKIDLFPEYCLSYYQNFAQYKALTFILHNYVCSIAYPQKTELDFNIAELKKFKFSN